MNAASTQRDRRKGREAKLRRRPTRRAVWLFAAGGAVAALPTVVDTSLWPWWFAYCTAFLLAAGYDVLAGPRLGEVRLRFFSISQLRKLYVGAKYNFVLDVENPTPRRFRCEWKLDVETPLEDPQSSVCHCLANQDTQVVFPIVARYRGQARIPSVWARGSGPFGLVAVQRVFDLNLQVAVEPDLPAVTNQAAQIVSARSLMHGARIERFRGDGSEFDQLLDYVPGMDVRTLDWKASARHGAMRCRQTRAERNREVLIAIDSGRLMGEPLVGLPRLDHAITAGLTLAYVSLRVGDKVGLAAFDERLTQYCKPQSGMGTMSALNEVATRIQYSYAETNFTLGLMELARRQSRRSLIVVMTDFVDTITSELMLENVARLSMRHLVVFVAFRDPLLESVACAPPDDFVAMQRAVVSHRLDNERSMVLRKLQRLGVMTVDAAPGNVAPMWIDRYVAAKRQEKF